MKYTNKTLPEGIVFTTSSEKYRVENIRVEDGKCHLVPLQAGSINQPDYPLSIVVSSLNDGSWKVEETSYEIF